MLFAIHLKNKNTRKERVYKSEAERIEDAHCPLLFYGSEWVWTGTEPFVNIEDKVMPEKPRSRYYVKR